MRPECTNTDDAAEQALALDRAVMKPFCLIRPKSGGPRRGPSCGLRPVLDGGSLGTCE